MMTLTPNDFRAFFAEVHGYEPFPWQARLLEHVVKQDGAWPSILDLPTGSGKTAAIDIAVYHLALEASRGAERQAPIRIAVVVDRRLVVDDAFQRARRIAEVLVNPPGPVTREVAAQLASLSPEGVPLVARRLRGGIPREDDWARTPSQPTVLCSTVDQVGSRLLFRGYGVADTMKPVHAGLIGSDCLILLDEAHLAEPFRQTLQWVQMYQGTSWRERPDVGPWRVALLTATPGLDREKAFSLSDDDRAHAVLAKRLDASKQARLVLAGVRKEEKGRDESGEDDDDLELRVATLVREVRNALDHFRRPESGVSSPAIAVVVNRVARARRVWERIGHELRREGDNAGIGEPVLMVGPARPVDRDDLAVTLEPIRTRSWSEGESRHLGRSLIIVATQCIEAGVDIDVDALITEVAPMDALRQRFGRLNRAGRSLIPYAAIVATKMDTSVRYEDPIYGKALQATWQELSDAGAEGVDFGLTAFRLQMTPNVLAPRADAPVLLPAHVDLLSQTSPIPSTDPDIGLYLHGPDRQSDSVSVIWRSDLIPNTHRDDDDVRRLLLAVPPRATEAIELPLWAVRRWLAGRDQVLPDLADVASPSRDSDGQSNRDSSRWVVRWKGDNEQSQWVTPARIRSGDTIIVPGQYGGTDRFGWNPKSGPVVDVGRLAAEPFAGRRFVVRVAPGLVGDSVADGDLAAALATAPARDWKALRDAVLRLPVPEWVRSDLRLLDAARKGKVIAYLDLHGSDEEDRPRGVVFAAPCGIAVDRSAEPEQLSTTEDDVAGSVLGFAVPLHDHNRDVAGKAMDFARRAGFASDLAEDIALAGLLHDVGKADPRFQAWLYYGDPLGPDPGQVLAKSGRPLPPAARVASGLPDRWRHEACSVRLALADARFAKAHDPELVLWLVGTHHGHGRPFYPHSDLHDVAPNVGPQCLAFSWRGLDWPMLHRRVRSRYGTWELARIETVLRLADHRASEDAALKDGFQ